MTIDSELREVNIEDLEPKMSNLELSFKVLEKGEPKTVSSRRDGSVHSVADAVVGDETGTVVVPLWDDSIDQLEIGKTYELKNGFTGLFRQMLRLKISSKSELSEAEEEIEEVNQDVDMSSEEHGRRHRDYGGGYDYRTSSFRGKNRGRDDRKGTYHGRRRW